MHREGFLEEAAFERTSREDSSIRERGVSPPGDGDSHASPGQHGTHTLTSLVESWSVGGEWGGEGRQGPDQALTISCVYLSTGPFTESQAWLPGRPSKAAPHVREGMAVIRPRSPARLQHPEDHGLPSQTGASLLSALGSRNLESVR